ncbi:uncharacterized protein [Haliotis asinina]|uniref:uncharacterized protein n=1 Tax=Haliotis asinina TaxID=109174 RepID=UPI003531E481
MSARRESQTESIHLATISPLEPDAPVLDYQPLHRYYEIREEDMDTDEPVTPPRRSADSEEAMNRPHCVAPSLRSADPGGGMDRLQCVAPSLRSADPGGGMNRLECVVPPLRPADHGGGMNRLECVAPPLRSAHHGGGMDRPECVTPPLRPADPELGIGNMVVLADVLQAAADADDGAGVASGSSTRDPHTYTHLTSVPVDDQVNYISPTESESDQQV